MDRNGRRYTQFKGIKSYKDIVIKNDKLLNAYEKIIASSKAKNEIRGKINDIKIDEDWILKIEEYLPYISSCIQEDRKFIKREGETVPIEKVKKVGRESVIDLAMHSKNIRQIANNGDIEPSKILIVEKLDDYSIYENKFLVFLLKYLKSFVEIRFDKIREAKSLYETKTSLTNQANLFRNTLSYTIEINDKRFRDLNLEANDKNTYLIQRIRNIEVAINQLLHTNLIESVSKTAPIKPPIQKTNVLKNDVNFARAVELYEFITNYSKPGFEIIPIETVKTELSDEYLSYFSMIPTLLAFFSYAEVKDLFELYEEELNKEIIELRELELEKNLRKIHEMIGKNELDVKLIYKYIVDMEEENKFLNDKIKKMEISHKKEIDDLTTSFKNEIQLLNENHEQEINELNEKYTEEIKTMESNFNVAIEKLNDEIKILHFNYNEKINELNTTIKSLNNSIDELIFKKKELEARLKAAFIANDTKFEENENSADYFDALETQKKIFDEYFEKKWTQVRKNILKQEKSKAIEEIKNKKAKRKEKKSGEQE